MYNDRIDLTLPEASLEQIVSFLLSAEELLSSLKSVTPTDRKHLAKLGLKNETLARDIIEVGRANLDLIPRGINFEKIDRDLIARDQLRSLKFLLERLLGKIKDSLLLTGVDIYGAALAIYHSLKRNGECASLKDVVDELKKGFARPNRKKNGEEQTESIPEKSVEERTTSSPQPHSIDHTASVPSEEPLLVETQASSTTTPANAPSHGTPVIIPKQHQAPLPTTSYAFPLPPSHHAPMVLSTIPLTFLASDAILSAGLALSPHTRPR